MTGFGEAHSQQDSLAVSVEVRAINSRYFKLAMRSGEGYSALEPQIENLVRQHIKRGTVQVNLRVDRTHRADDFKINANVLCSYRDQLEKLRVAWHATEPVRLDDLLLLPGVVEEQRHGSEDAETDWPAISATVQAAMENMAQMRAEEGRAMATDLTNNCRAIAKELDEIERRAPLVAEAYRERLVDRLTRILDEHEITLQAGDLVREIGIYAERSDISEEIVRLRSHLEQFGTIMALEESSGRKLEFVTQEMGRETNTIGSKANDVQISRHVIEIKAAIERIREMIQNVE
jgi:uncharacterized protein (TIGR00255 family)